MGREPVQGTKIEVVPREANVGGLDIGYEDFLAVRIECRKAITKAQARDLEALYDGWRARVEKASRKVSRDDGEELLPIRFDSFAVSGPRAHGGASRFLVAEEACRWLARELAKVPGVVKVSFGEEDVAATPRAGAARPASAAADRVTKVLAGVLGKEKSSAKALGCISIRFTVEALASPGKVLRQLIDEALGLVGDVGSIWVRGTWGVTGSLEEVNQGRELREKAGRALLDRVLEDVARMPKSARDPRIVNLVLSDGPRPERKSGIWQDGSRVASGFGVQIRLQPPEARPSGGQIEIYFPLADLDSSPRRDAWIAFGERAFASVHGSVGTMSPALWMEAIAPDGLPLALFSHLPAVAIPRLVGVHAGGFSFPDFSPDVHNGLFEPPWIAWLSSPLAGRVSAYPGTRRVIAGGEELRVEEDAPLEMDDARYARYRAAWAALEPLRIRWTDSDDGDAWRHALDRFDASSLGDLEALLTKRQKAAARSTKLYWSSRKAVREGQGKKAFAEAEEAIALGGSSEMYEILLEAVLCFRGEGKPNLEIAPKALAIALPFATSGRVALLAAKLYMALGDREGALAVLAASSTGDPKPTALEADPAFAPLLDDDRFRRAVGWPSRAALEQLRAQDAKPDLKAFPKLAKAVAKAPGQALFAPGAKKKALDDVERALGLELPAVYRAMLASFDGAVFRDGRELLFPTADLVARNQGRQHGTEDELVIGRNLILYPRNVKEGEAHLAEVHGVRSPNTTLRWKKLDACLADLLRGAS